MVVILGFPALVLVKAVTRLGFSLGRGMLVGGVLFRGLSRGLVRVGRGELVRDLHCRFDVMD